MHTTNTDRHQLTANTKPNPSQHPLGRGQRSLIRSQWDHSRMTIYCLWTETGDNISFHIWPPALTWLKFPTKASEWQLNHHHDWVHPLATTIRCSYTLKASKWTVWDHYVELLYSKLRMNFNLLKVHSCVAFVLTMIISMKKNIIIYFSLFKTLLIHM